MGPFHVIARGHVGPSLLAMILYAKYGEHQPLNRPSETYAREGVDLDVSTLADHVGAGAAVRRPLTELIRRHVFAAERVHGDDTTVPLLAKGKTITARLWTYVRDDRPFAGPDPPAAVFFYSRNRAGEHPARHLACYAGILQADAYAGFGELYDGKRKPGPITEAACWSHGRRKFFELADLRKAPLAVAAVRRIDELFAIERTINGLPAGDRLAARQRGSAAAGKQAGCRRSRKLDAHRTCPAVAPCRDRQGDRLHADPLAGLHPLPRRWPHLPFEQRRRARITRNCPGTPSVVVRRLRPRRREGSGDLHADRHRQAQRHQPAGLARRRARPHRRPSRLPAPRTPSLALEAKPGSSRRRLITGPPRSSADAYVSSSDTSKPTKYGTTSSE